MNTATAAPARRLALTAEIVTSRPFSEWERDELGRPITADVVELASIEFPGADDLADFLVYKGLSPERAALVIYRKCSFTIEPAEGMVSRRYRVAYAD